jgi:hypothetical protein
MPTGVYKRKEGWKPKNGFKKGQAQRKGASVSIETRKKMSISKIGVRIGDKNPMWKGGITPIHKKIRESYEYKLWREAVLKRDNYTCIWCGVKEKIMDIDHIKSFKDFPELRFAIDNGRTLCRKCHITTHSWGKNV